MEYQHLQTNALGEPPAQQGSQIPTPQQNSPISKNGEAAAAASEAALPPQHSCQAPRPSSSSQSNNVQSLPPPQDNSGSNQNVVNMEGFHVGHMNIILSGSTVIILLGVALFLWY